MTKARNELFVSRSMDDGASFYLENNPAAGENYFLEIVPDELVECEHHCWEPTTSAGFAGLKDVY